MSNKPFRNHRSLSLLSKRALISTCASASLEKARSSSEELRDLVRELLRNDQHLAQKLDRLEIRTIRSSDESISASVIGKDGDNSTIRSATAASKASQRLSIRQEFSTTLSFERDLQTSRAYGRVAHRYSHLSLPSSKGKSCGWSYYSNISLSDISNISVFSLPLSVRDLYSAAQYVASNNLNPEKPSVGPNTATRRLFLERSLARERPPPSVSARTGVFPIAPAMSDNAILVELSVRSESIDATEAALSWPPGQVAEWLLSNCSVLLQGAVINQFLTDDTSGFSILFNQYEDIADMGIIDVDQRVMLWRSIQDLQGLIFDETLYRQKTITGLIQDAIKAGFRDPIRAEFHSASTSLPSVLGDGEVIDKITGHSLDSNMASLLGETDNSRTPHGW